MTSAISYAAITAPLIKPLCRKAEGGDEMYILQETPDEKVELENGSIATPVATLKDEYGGVSHIITDDHCYVLVNGSYDRGFRTVKHWNPEAIDALRTLPTPKPA